MNAHAVTHRTVEEEFVDLVLADDELVRREFEALVARGWGPDVPRESVPRGGGRCDGAGRHPWTPLSPVPSDAPPGPPWGRQRGPPS